MSKNTHPKNFDDALSELESVVAQIEAGQLPLEQALASFKRGSELLQYCQKTLATAEQKIQILNETNDLKNYVETDES